MSKTANAVSVGNKALGFLSELDSVILKSSQTIVADKVDRLFDGMCPAEGSIIEIDSETAPVPFRYAPEGVAYVKACPSMFCKCNRTEQDYLNFIEDQMEGKSFLQKKLFDLEVEINNGRDPAPFVQDWELKLNWLVFPDLYQ